MPTPNAPDQSICSLGVSDRTLSALRDDAVSRAEAAHLAAHVENCPVCSERLAAFDNLASIVRSERSPEPDERLWSSLTTAAGSSGWPAHIRPLRFPGSGPTHPSWSRVSALVAVILLTVGFVALFSFQRLIVPAQPKPTATRLPTATLAPAPTATPLPDLLPAHPLAWRPLGATEPSDSIAFANDGKTAYRCSTQFNSPLNIWRTTDRGAHWIPARAFPTDPTMNACELLVDASDPSVAALAWQPRGGGAGDSYTGLMTTVDGGTTWQAVPSQPYIHIDQLDSRGGVIFAVRETVSTTNTVEYHLWASSDRMRTWRQVDHGLAPAVAGFWLQPEGSGILVIVSGGANAIASQLWTSPDGGATWHQLNVPGGLPSYMLARMVGLGMQASGIVVRSLQGHFHICVSNATVATSTPTPQSSVTCSIDGGATWRVRKLLLLDTSQGFSVGVNLVGITNDGTLLASGLGTLYRLAADSDRWQPLGPLPQLGVVYCPSPGAGMLWAAPAIAGDSTDPQNRTFTALYTP